MSMYLFNEQPILANKTLAREIGLNEALVLQQINYWIEINKKSGNNYYNGKYWTYNSIRAWHEKDFDYMSLDTVKRTFSKLEKNGYLLVGNFNKDSRDKTKWYTINNDKLEELYAQIEEKKKKTEQEILEQVSSEKVAEEPMPNALVQNALMERGKMHQCNNAKSTNAEEQNAPMQQGKIHQPLPKITTNITTDISSEITTNPSVLPSVLENNNIQEDRWEDGKEENKDIYNIQLENLREQVGYYEHIEVGNIHIARKYDEIIKILADVMILDENEVITINQTKLAVNVVKARFKELKSEHLEYILEILKDSEQKIRNIRAFILTASYNAPSNIDAYYSALVSYDMKGGH